MAPNPSRQFPAKRSLFSCLVAFGGCRKAVARFDRLLDRPNTLCLPCSPVPDLAVAARLDAEVVPKRWPSNSLATDREAANREAMAERRRRRGRDGIQSHRGLGRLG